MTRREPVLISTVTAMPGPACGRAKRAPHSSGLAPLGSLVAAAVPALSLASVLSRLSSAIASCDTSSTWPCNRP